jgi:PAS domain S-box-containing protein
VDTDNDGGGDQGHALESIGGQEPYRRLFTDLGVGVLILDQDGYLVSVNNRGAALCGAAPGDLSGRHLTELCATDLPSEVSELLSTAAGAPVSAELRIRSAGCRALPVQASFSPVSDLPDGRACYSVSLTDISTHLERAKQHQREAEKLGVLLRETHHRVKNNLQIIASLVGILAGSEDKAPAWVESLEQRIRAISMVHDTLYASSTYSDVDFDDYVRRMVDHTMSTVSLATQVEVDIDIASPRIGLSEVLPLGIILSEFLINSAKYAFVDRSRGSVTIRQWEEGNRVVLEYHDDGPGLPADTESPSADSKAAIGLEIVGALMEQLNGSVTFEDPPGFSARLTFRRRG